MKRHFNKKVFFKTLFFVLVFIAVISLIVLLLWNWLMPAIFDLPEINYLQAIGILILAKILFMGIGGKHSHRDHFKDKEYWKKKFDEYKNFSSEKSSEDNIP